jgi:hypothetical protein
MVKPSPRVRAQFESNLRAAKDSVFRRLCYGLYKGGLYDPPMGNQMVDFTLSAATRAAQAPVTVTGTNTTALGAGPVTATMATYTTSALRLFGLT